MNDPYEEDTQSHRQYHKHTDYFSKNVQRNRYQHQTCHLCTHVVHQNLSVQLRLWRGNHGTAYVHYSGCCSLRQLLVFCGCTFPIIFYFALFVSAIVNFDWKEKQKQKKTQNSHQFYFLLTLTILYLENTPPACPLSLCSLILFCISSSTVINSLSSASRSTNSVPGLDGVDQNPPQLATSLSIPFINLCLKPYAEIPICFKSSWPISASMSNVICSLSNISSKCSKFKLKQTY